MTSFQRLNRVLGVTVFAVPILSFPLSAQNSCRGRCDEENPRHLPDICMHSAFDNSSGTTHVSVTLSCPAGSKTGRIEIGEGTELQGKVGPVIAGNALMEFDIVNDPPVKSIPVRGTCLNTREGREAFITRDFCVDYESSGENLDPGENLGPQPVIWTGSGPDGLEGFDFQVALVWIDGAPDHETAYRIEVIKRLSDRSSYRIGLTRAESVEQILVAGGQAQSIRASRDHLLADFSYDLDLWGYRRLETSAFFGPGWAFVSGDDHVAQGGGSLTNLEDSEGLTAHFGLGLKARLSDRVYWSATARARWFEARVDDELDTEIAIGVGFRFGGQQ